MRKRYLWQRAAADQRSLPHPLAGEPVARLNGGGHGGFLELHVIWMELLASAAVYKFMNTGSKLIPVDVWIDRREYY